MAGKVRNGITNAISLTRQLSLLFAVYLGGELAVRLTRAPLPGSVAGMLIMLMLLASGVVPVRRVEEIAEILTNRISLLLLPALVGLVTYWPLFNGMVIPLLAVVICSTLAVMLGSAAVTVLVGRRFRHANR